jgi:hypothetical protein
MKDGREKTGDGSQEDDRFFGLQTSDFRLQKILR